jgi:membrane protein involved in colicin uptake
MRRTTSPTASLIRAALIGLALTIGATSVDAAPRKARPAATELTSAEETAVRAELAAAKRAGIRARAKLKALKARGAADKAATRAERAARKAKAAAWLVDCIDERTGPVGGIDEEDAAVVCADEARFRERGAE